MALNQLYNQKQINIMRDVMTHDFFTLINHGAKRSGKTFLDNDLFLMDLRRCRRLADAAGVRSPQYILAAADLSSLHRNVLSDLSQKYDLEFRFDKANRFELFGVKVCCFGHSKINDLGRIRGMTAWGAYINEATVANRVVFDEILSRCSGHGARIIMDTNPDRPSHWLKTDYIDRAAQSGGKILEYHWKLTDNPAIGQDYIDNIVATTPSGMFYDRNVNGLWVAAEGAVYPDFDRAVHYVSVDDVPDIYAYWAGMDFGWEHPGALVLLGEGTDGNTYLLKEWSSQHRNIREWIRIIQEDIEPTTGELHVYCDSARPDLINDMQCAGVWADNAHKDVVAGIGEVATMWKNRTLYVVKENVDLFDREIDAYVWQDGKDAPVKTGDDVMDALRYGVYSERVEREEGVSMNTAGFLRGGI